MIYLILRLLIAALLALTGVATEDVTLRSGEVVTDDADETGDPIAPSELPGPSELRGRHRDMQKPSLRWGFRHSGMTRIRGREIVPVPADTFPSIWKVFEPAVND